MTRNKFKAVKVGDSVTLAVNVATYCGCANRIRRAGEVGIVKAAHVPAVRGRERDFHCVDFANGDRVGAFREELV